MSTLSQAQKANLASPEALSALTLLQQNGWLDVDQVQLNQAFAGDTENEAYKLLATQSKGAGGASSKAALGIWLLLAVATLLATTGQVVELGQMSLTTLTVWGALGLSLALLVRRWPGVANKLK